DAAAVTARATASLMCRVTAAPPMPPRLAAERRRGEHLQHQVAPAVQQDGPVVELDGQHVRFAGLFQGPQVIANPAGAYAQVVVAEADLRQVFAAHHAGVRGPEAPL